MIVGQEDAAADINTFVGFKIATQTDDTGASVKYCQVALSLDTQTGRVAADGQRMGAGTRN
jgi:hypothetical protein